MGACSTLKWAPKSATPCKGEPCEGQDAKSPCAGCQRSLCVLSYVYFCRKKHSAAVVSISKFSINHYVPCEDHFYFLFVKSDRLSVHILRKVKQFGHWRNKDKGPQITTGSALSDWSLLELRTCRLWSDSGCWVLSESLTTLDVWFPSLE